MRLSFMCPIIISTLVGLAPAYSYSELNVSRFSTCYCHFGYPDRPLLPQVSCLAAGGRCKEVRYQYSSCNCHFGSSNVCLPQTSCDSEGGLCSGSCEPSELGK
jgi:hypothetical protein